MEKVRQTFGCCSIKKRKSSHCRVVVCNSRKSFAASVILTKIPAAIYIKTHCHFSFGAKGRLHVTDRSSLELCSFAVAIREDVVGREDNQDEPRQVLPVRWVRRRVHGGDGPSAGHHQSSPSDDAFARGRRATFVPRNVRLREEVDPTGGSARPVPRNGCPTHRRCAHLRLEFLRFRLRKKYDPTSMQYFFTAKQH